MTGVVAAVQRLVSVKALDLSMASNGDLVLWLNLGFRCRFVRGEARVNDDESVQVGFDVDLLPELEPDRAGCLDSPFTRTAKPGFQETPDPISG